MKVEYFDEWQAVSYVQIIWFAVLAFANIVLLFTFYSSFLNKKQLWMFSGYFGVFTIAKIAGGVLGIIFLHKPEFDQGLYIAVYVCDSVSLGMLLKSSFPFIQRMLKKEANPDQEMYNGEPIKGYGPFDVETKPVKPTLIQKYFLGPFQFLTLLVLVSVILSIVGSSLMSSSNGNVTPLKVSSLLFLASTLVLGGIVIYVNFNNPNYVFPARLLMCCAFLLVVRCLYSILSSFNHLSFTNPSKFSLMFGDYKYFTFLALLMESLVGIALILTYQWFLRKGRFN